MRFFVMWCWCIAALTAADTFVTRSGSGFQYAGNTFHPAGTNCYYLSYKSDAMIASVLDDAKAMGLSVVRVWGFMDCGNGDPGATPAVLPLDNKDGVYFQYWNTATNSLTINDGPDGLQRLDKVIAMADARGLKVTVVLVNNWIAFGGMDQYLSWFSQAFHDQFYTNSSIVSAYQAYVGHLINRPNTVNGRLYKNDTAIFSWELANEPRCIGSSGGLNRTTIWTTATITTWAGTMANFIKGLDPNHLVAVGDEGFFNRVSADWAYAGEGGVDHEALLALTGIDYGTFHCYPDVNHWNKDVAWGSQWIIDHCAAATVANKPTVLGEYGLEVPRNSESLRMSAYNLWNNALRTNGGDGSWFWMLAGFDPSGPGLRYPDYDHFTVYLDGSPWQPGTATADDDDVLSSQAFQLRGLDNRMPIAVASAVASGVSLTAACDGSGSSDPDGQALTYAWTFGDGSTGAGLAPSHLYAASGTYSVTMTVSDPYGVTDSDTRNVSVTTIGGGGGGGGSGSSTSAGGGGCGLGAGLALLVSVMSVMRLHHRAVYSRQTPRA